MGTTKAWSRYLLILVLLLALPLAGCNDSSGDNNNTSTSQTSVTGTVSDGAIQGASVYLLDANDQRYPSDTTTVLTDKFGQFEVKVPQTAKAPFRIVASGGNDTEDGSELLSDYFGLISSASGNTITAEVTPMTTLTYYTALANAKGNASAITQQHIVSAKEAVQDSFGLGMNFDPLTSSSVLLEGDITNATKITEVANYRVAIDYLKKIVQQDNASSNLTDNNFVDTAMILALDMANGDLDGNNTGDVAAQDLGLDIDGEELESQQENLFNAYQNATETIEQDTETFIRESIEALKTYTEKNTGQTSEKFEEIIDNHPDLVVPTIDDDQKSQDDDQDTQGEGQGHGQGDNQEGNDTFEQANLLLNEFKANIPEDKHSLQYIELRGNAGVAITNTWLLVIDGDEDSEGQVDYALNLNGKKVGSNGLIIIKNENEYNDVVPQATSIINEPLIRTYDADIDGDELEDGILEHDAITYMLVQSNATFNRGDDLDADNDGQLELPDDSTVIDSLGHHDGGDGYVYSEVVLAQSASDPDAATRFRDNTTANSLDAWANGDIYEDPDKDDDQMAAELIYDTLQASSNLPPRAKLTPGDHNFLQAPFVLLNEIVAGGDKKFIELMSNPSQDLKDIYLIAVTSQGNASFSVDLSEYQAKQAGLTAVLNTGVNIEKGSELTSLEADLSSLSSATKTTVLLVYSPQEAIVAGTDLDSDNDGELELPSGSIVLDNFGWNNSPYSDFLASNEVLVDGATRHKDNRICALSSWTYGELDENASYVEDKYKNGPEDAYITYGNVNFAKETSLLVKPTLETKRSPAANADADDIAFWIHPTDKSKSMIIGSQKIAGFSVYANNGTTLQDVLPENVRYNNIDVMYGFELGNGTVVDIALFTDRMANKFAIYQIKDSKPYLVDITDPASAELFEAEEAGEDTAYGQGVYKSPVSGKFYAFATQNGYWNVVQVELVSSDDKIGWQEVRKITLEADDDDKHAEGIVVDQEYGKVYIAQEEVGVYTLDAEPGDEPTDIALTEDDLLIEEGDHDMVEDLEGMSIYYNSDGTGYVFLSSQGNNLYGVFNRAKVGVKNQFLTSFAIVNDMNGIDGVQETDSLDVTNVAISDQFSNGVFIVQDGMDTTDDADDVGTNFKWMKWEDIATRLGTQSMQSSYDPRNPQDLRSASFNLTVMHVNDTHSHLTPTTGQGLTFNGTEYDCEVGGYAKLKTAVDNISNCTNNTLFLHAGDALQGTLYFTLYQGDADIVALNALGLDAMVVGNHEFDKGADLLANFVANATFDLLGANVETTEDSPLNGVFGDYTIKDFDGEKVGILGLVTPSTSITSSPGDTVSFAATVATAQAMVAELEGQGVNKIIALTHLGFDDDKALAQAVDGIDIVVGGHSHTLLGDFFSLGLSAQDVYPVEVQSPNGNPVYVLQSWEWAKALGVANIGFDSNGVISAIDGTPVILLSDSFEYENGTEVEGADKQALLDMIDGMPQVGVFEPNQTVADLIAPYTAGIVDMQDEVVAQVEEDLLHTRIPGTDKYSVGYDFPEGSYIAPLVAESLVYKANENGLEVDLSIQNAGGVRTAISAGNLTVEDVYTLLPFGNTLVVLELSGQEVIDAIEQGVDTAVDGVSTGAYPYLGHARYTVELNATSGERVTKVEVLTDDGTWVEIDPDATYRVAVNNYLASGGDGYSVLVAATGYRYDTGFIDAESFMDYAASLGTLTKPEQTSVDTGLPTTAFDGFAIISDPHFYDLELGANGTAFETYLAQDRKLLKESNAILGVAIDKIKEENPSFVIIPGDLTKDGAYSSHQKFAARLKTLEDAGIEVYVICGNHDINNPHAVSYEGETTTSVAQVSPEEFKTLYADFGYSQALATDPNSMSYVVEPEDGIWLIAMDSCDYNDNEDEPVTSGRFNSETLDWIKDEIKAGKAAGKHVIGMMHHGILEHYEGQAQLFDEYVVEDWRRISKELGEAGMHVVFTGHYHAQDAVQSTVAGLTDVETGSLLTYPCPIRWAEIDEDDLAITSDFISDIDYDTGNQTFSEYALDYLQQGLSNLAMYQLTASTEDGGFGLTVEQAEALAPLIIEAFTAHYAGDESPSAQTSAQIQAMLASDDTAQMGQYLLTFWTDIDPADNYLTVDMEMEPAPVMTRMTTFATGDFDAGAAEIPAYDPDTQRVFVINGADKTVDIMDFSDTSSLSRIDQIDLSTWGAAANSCAFKNGILAVAVEAETKQDNGRIVFFAANGTYINDVETGALPDMVKFTPDGKYVLAANEGEPNSDYSNDPEGSVSIVNIEDINNPQSYLATFEGFNDNATLKQAIHLTGFNGATLAQDIEPEYIAVSSDSSKAYVTLQENNAIAEIDIASHSVARMMPLGYKNHTIPGQGLDASDKDDKVNIANWPVYGMYQPDSLASFEINGTLYLATANEGDSRDYSDDSDYNEEDRVKDLTLDSTVFANAEALQDKEALGRLTVTNTQGDTDGDGDFDALYAFGGRSFSIFKVSDQGLELVFDSGDQFEQIVAQTIHANFNCDNTENKFDKRSDNKGAEPEGIDVGVVGDKILAFVGLERQGGIMVYDVTQPEQAKYVDYIVARDFSKEPEAEMDEVGDLGPEGMHIIEAADSPTGKPMLIVGNEVSGTTTIYEVQ